MPIATLTESFRYQDWLHPARLHAASIGDVFAYLASEIRHDHLMSLFHSEETVWSDADLLRFCRAMGMPDYGPYRRADRPDREWTQATASLFVKLVREEREDLLCYLGISGAPLEVVEEPPITQTTPTVEVPPVPPLLPSPAIDTTSRGGAVVEDEPKFRPGKRRKR